jgi:BirA family biotin operon repressor/biotin-[acetyl-CoA-carboxylase] ligase
MATPYSLQVYDEVTSTQDVALRDFAGEPLLVVAARQNAGRGRQGRSWISAPRALAASLAVRPSWPAQQWTTIPLVAGLAAADVLGPSVGLKWPNDLVLDGRKLGGILVEGANALIVAGLGVNLWWPDPPDSMTAAHDVDPGPDRLVGVARDWVARLLERLASAPEQWGRTEYLARCVTIGEEITWSPRGQGTAIDVDQAGALVVETSLGLERLVAGDIDHIRRA